VSVIDCCTREIVGWDLSNRCRTEDALAAVEQALLHRLPAGSREANLTLTTDNGTQFTSSRFLETLGRLGITHRHTAYHHPEGNSYIERFHRTLKEYRKSHGRSANANKAAAPRTGARGSDAGAQKLPSRPPGCSG
jgi:transposase InsO family protein